MNRFAVGTGVHEIRDRVDEGMFIADAVARRPPVRDVRLDAVALRHEDVAETLPVFRIVAVVKFQPVHVLEIKVDRAFAAVDFEFDVIASSQRILCGFEVRHHAAFHPAEERRRIRRGDFAELALALREQIRARTFRHERVNDAANTGEFANEMACKVNDVGIDVAVNAAAAGLFLQPPVERKFWIRQPVLRVAGAKMINFSKRAFGQHPLRQRDGWNAAVIVADHVDAFRLFRGGENGLAFLQVAPQRFFAEDVLAVFQRGDGDFRVRERRRADVHDVNQRRFHDLAPVRRGELPAELRARGLHGGGIAAADRVHLDVRLEVEKFRRLPPRVRVRAAHEFVADETDAKCFGHKSWD